MVLTSFHGMSAPFIFIYLLALFCSWDRASLVVLSVLDLNTRRDLLASVSIVLELKACATIPNTYYDRWFACKLSEYKSLRPVWAYDFTALLKHLS